MFRPVVLDLGCGKGADINKFNIERISGYVGIDISGGQLIDALNRCLVKNYQFPTLFIKGKGQDTKEEFNMHIPKNLKFNIISAQFCIHYFFETEYTVRNFLQNVSNNLAKGGFFIATFPDSKVIAKKFYKFGKIDEETKLNYIENKFYSIVTNISNFGKINSPFGNKYGFFLDDGLIGDKIKKKNVTTKYHIPEYLIVSDHLIEIAKEYDLKIEIDKNFHDFFAENLEKNIDFFDSRFFRREKGKRLMNDELWECSYLYKIIMFKKISGEKALKDNSKLLGKRDYWEIKNIDSELFK